MAQATATIASTAYASTVAHAVPIMPNAGTSHTFATTTTTAAVPVATG